MRDACRISCCTPAPRRREPPGNTSVTWDTHSQPTEQPSHRISRALLLLLRQRRRRLGRLTGTSCSRRQAHTSNRSSSCSLRSQTLRWRCTAPGLQASSTLSGTQQAVQQTVNEFVLSQLLPQAPAPARMRIRQPVPECMQDPSFSTATSQARHIQLLLTAWHVPYASVGELRWQ